MANHTIFRENPRANITKLNPAWNKNGKTEPNRTKPEKIK